MSFNIRFRFLFALCGNFLVMTLSGAALDPGTVPPDARWLVHLDVAGARETTLGRYMINEVLAPRIDTSAEGFQFDFVKAVQLADSVTAFGERLDFQNGGNDLTGVLLVGGQPQLTAMVSGLLSYQVLHDEATLVQDEPYPLFQLGNGLLVASFSETSMAVSRSRKAIGEADRNLRGESSRPERPDQFEALSNRSAGGLLVAVFDGLNEITELPPQAKVFQLTKGLALHVGNQSDTLTADVSLLTDSTLNARLVGQILQGLIAMGSLVQEDPYGAGQFLQLMAVRNEGRRVELHASVPSAQIIALIDSLCPPPEKTTDGNGGK